MPNIISIHHRLLQFLVLIYIIPIYVKSGSQIQFLFLNGLNVIRCSDDQVQVYNFGKKDIGGIYSQLECKNKKDVIDDKYVGYKWSTLKIMCSEDNKMHEEQLIVEKFESANDIDKFPDVEKQLAQDAQPFSLTVEHIESETDEANFIAKIITSDQSADDTLSTKTIYISFSDHPITCRLRYKKKKESCSSGPIKEVEDVDYACYYNPAGEKAPTIKETRAELKQVEKAKKDKDKDAYVLDLQKPEIDTSDSSSNEDPDEKKKPSSETNSNPDQSPKTNGTNSAHKSLKTEKKKQTILKIIGLIFGILLLIALIGGIAFYMIRKSRSNNSLSSSTSIEKGRNKGLSSLGPNQSSQSLSVASTDDTNTDISMKVPIKNEKPTIEVQPFGGNKRQRAGTNMTFNEDMQ